MLFTILVLQWCVVRDVPSIRCWNLLGMRKSIVFVIPGLFNFRDLSSRGTVRTSVLVRFLTKISHW